MSGSSADELRFCLRRPLYTSAAKAVMWSSLWRECSVFDATWSGHLELEISIVWHRVEPSKCGSSKQCVIATAKRDNIKD